MAANQSRVWDKRTNKHDKNPLKKQTLAQFSKNIHSQSTSVRLYPYFHIDEAYLLDLILYYIQDMSTINHHQFFVLLIIVIYNNRNVLGRVAGFYLYSVWRFQAIWYITDTEIQLL